MLFVPYLFARSFKMKSPTSSHNSAPSKLPIVASNIPSLSFFTQGDPLRSRIEFLEFLLGDLGVFPSEVVSVGW